MCEDDAVFWTMKEVSTSNEMISKVSKYISGHLQPGTYEINAFKDSTSFGISQITMGFMSSDFLNTTYKSTNKDALSNCDAEVSDWPLALQRQKTRDPEIIKYNYPNLRKSPEKLADSY